MAREHARHEDLIAESDLLLLENLFVRYFEVHMDMLYFIALGRNMRRANRYID